GTTNRNFTVKSIGKYYVTVTDNNGCKGSDTTAVTTINPSPQAFLPADTSICSYGSLQLKPLSPYKNYLWSTGGIAPSIAITQPGIYWLQVQDNNNCKGKDTIAVNPKDCISGFYI